MKTFSKKQILHKILKNHNQQSLNHKKINKTQYKIQNQMILISQSQQQNNNNKQTSQQLLITTQP